MSLPESSILGSHDRIVEALYRIVHSIQTDGDLTNLLKAIMEESKSLLDSAASSLFLYDSEKDDLYFEVVVGGDEGIRAIRVPIGQGIVGACASQRKTVVVNDCANDPRHFKMGGEGGFVTRNLIAVPMIRNDRLIGVLEVLNKNNDASYNDMDVKILEIMAEQAAVQIENTQLIRAKIKSERLAALGTTAAGLAHYIKNVLSQWKGSSTLIELGLKSKNVELMTEAWGVLKRSNEKIAKLVQDMLAISKERPPDRQPININLLISDILAESKGRALQAEVELEQDFDLGIPISDLDPSRMHDVILNLVGNSIEALEEARIPSGRVIVRTKHISKERLIVVEVKDNGPGMTPEVKARVMEPFFSTKGSRGTGLGLAVALKTIEEHGGEMTLDTEVGRGTTFRIEIPIMEPEGH